MIKATTLDAYNLLHHGTHVMTEMERNGIHIDVDYVHRTRTKIQKKIERLTEEIEKDKIFKVWQKTYGRKTNLGSRTQLAHVLFDVLKYPSPEETKKKTRHKTDVNALDDINEPFTKKYIQIEQLKKARNTYLVNILRETVNGYMHPNFNLHLVRTYRGSSDHPNFQNIPMRIPLIKKLVRRSFIPRPGHCIVDLDFKGSEVNAASWYHKDPLMLNYINNPEKDMHRDMAMQIYMLPKKEMTSAIRHCGKNMFVFPQFYGDWWMSCAKNLWKAIDRVDLQTASGIPLKKWLKSKGITSLGTGDSRNIKDGTFESHLEEVEYDFWHNRFSVYQQWKEDWWAKYQKLGYFKMLTGFTVGGLLNRKDVINYPVQGTAFHCLLWCLIRISKLLKKYKMKTKLIGQIHDDAVADVPKEELKDYIDLAMDVITNQLGKHWPWIITPMVVEVEVTPVDGSWYKKQKYKI